MLFMALGAVTLVLLFASAALTIGCAGVLLLSALRKARIRKVSSLPVSQKQEQ